MPTSRRFIKPPPRHTEAVVLQTRTCRSFAGAENAPYYRRHERYYGLMGDNQIGIQHRDGYQLTETAASG